MKGHNSDGHKKMLHVSKLVNLSQTFWLPKLFQHPSTPRDFYKVVTRRKCTVVTVIVLHLYSSTCKSHVNLCFLFLLFFFLIKVLSVLVAYNIRDKCTIRIETPHTFYTF